MDFAALGSWLPQWEPAQAILAGGGVLLVALLAALVAARWRRPRIVVARCAEAGVPRGLCARIGARLRGVLDALDYLTTRRKWRYGQPWMLVLGEQGAGKSSLVGSVSENLRHAPPKRAAELQAEGTDWAFFQAGVLIDVEGRLPAAEPGSDEGAAWKQTLAGLGALRPERPLDGVLLCVSARTLRDGKARAREHLAANVNRQLAALQEALEFALPVYVVVTQCDALDGFGAFWQCQPAARRQELFGYSATQQDQSRTPPEWAETGFDVLGERLRSLQVEVAAHTRQIGDVDQFFLFPRHLIALREPLALWLDTVFRATAWQTGHWFRGFYFTGAVDADGSLRQGVCSDVAFVDTLVHGKALAERGLARPTRQGLLSRNRLIRRLQIGSVAALLCLFVALGFTGVRFARQVDGLVGAIDALGRATPVSAQNDGCLPAEVVYPLLQQVAGLNTDTVYLVVPASWVDGRIARRSAHHVGATTVARVLMPALACHLEVKAHQLVASDTAAAPASGLAVQEAALRERVAEALALEENLARFHTLAWQAHTLEEGEQLQMLADLGRYAFGTSMPDGIQRPGNILDNAIGKLSKRANPSTPAAWQNVDLPARMRIRMAERIDRQGEAARAALSREVAQGGRLLKVLSHDEGQVLENTRELAGWLAWVSASWFAVAPGADPCGRILRSVRGGLETLQTRYGYPGSLRDTLTRFDPEQCFDPEVNVLDGMTLPPYGPVFVEGKAGRDLAPAMQAELDGLPELVTLGFMHLNAPLGFSCAGSTVRWHAAELAEAAGYLAEYEKFAEARKLPPLGTAERPLYDRLARAALERALDDALRRAQRPPGGSPLAQVSFDAVSRADTDLARTASELSPALPALQAVLQAYAGYGFADGGGTVRQCLADFAADQLGRVSALAAASRLYAPQAANSGDELFDTGSLPVLKDYLARQVARAQVLVGYASPFVSVMEAAPAVNAAQRDTAQTQTYWANTSAELNRYTQAKEPNGQVAALDDYFIRQLSGLSYANCDERLAAYSPPEPGNDLFSARRGQLEQQVSLRCVDRVQAQAFEVYQGWAVRFNRDLAGRYPFGEPDARDASPAAVRAFFLDFVAQRAALRDAMAALPKEEWREEHRFIAQLDAVAAFFSGNLLAGEHGGPVNLTVSFNVMPAAASGADQLVGWQLGTGPAHAGFPNRATTLDWYAGQPLALELTWADRSPWLPQNDPRQAGLRVEARRARFDLAAPWALLRLFALHRPQGLPEFDPANPAQRLLEFPVPLAGAPGADGKAAQGRARLFVSIGMRSIDPQSKTAAALKLPAEFPRSAPEEW
ncbi:hypothetical protein E6C76_14010 [Pseudothauera nasutitermitis]|uniref:Type VI secretion system component TssM1 N-terminal domain-containing protein n=1 Tax=Pseudothauera nasutitermitis TaxID=2565930 RepID=A0A4S4AUQ6_9RHOO|nr:type VI secretion system protein [Pseudothauera nasutitermitis]THF63699.1 hypothetical protein E6C76_14010 [Pseudothauera nasutitermitis]